jgi:hypothetical protein
LFLMTSVMWSSSPDKRFKLNGKLSLEVITV